jgi:hypothetical protein
MKKIIIILVIFLGAVLTINSTNHFSKYSLNKKGEKNEISFNFQQSSSQETMSGTWYWKSTNADSDTILYLTQNGNTVTGKHCSSFMGGSKLDCADIDTEDSITLDLVSENVYEGIIKSGFSEAVISVRITLNPNDETIFFSQLSQPNEEYYLPNNVTLTLAQP